MSNLLDKMANSTRSMRERCMGKGRFESAAGPATLCGVYVETDDATGRALRVEQVRLGGRLSEARP